MWAQFIEHASKVKHYVHKGRTQISLVSVETGLIAYLKIPYNFKNLECYITNG